MTTQESIQGRANVLANAPCHAVLSVTDLDRARSFYGKTLGLPVNDAPDLGGFMLTAGGNTQIFVYARDDPPRAENTVTSFFVDNVPATVTALRNNGVEFEEYDLPGMKTQDGIATMGDHQSAWFKDPDGNILCVSNPIV